MIQELAVDKRTIKQIDLETDLTIIGGGLAGVCAAITAARKGVKIVLVQDRPVLGGNASSEVRLWVLGATSHMGNNNRWAREGGVINEILVENIYRNAQSSPLIFDIILLEKVYEENNITLLLNTAVFDLEKEGDNISAVTAFCSQNSTQYHIKSPLYCDASGDGIAAFLSGAAFRMGAESESEFQEKFAPSKEYGELLGHSMYFYSKDAGKPVKYIAPSYALKDLSSIIKYRKFSVNDQGCNFWWLEYGGRMDTVHDTEKIKWELWKVIYGLWDHFKNSGLYPEAENMTLEWVATIPGKRESRRFEGDYILKQQDIVTQQDFEDTVAYGGWSIDLHPADGLYSDKPSCNQWHSKGIYGIPYRCYYSKNIKNLFVAGRIISATHVAFGSSRVMGTCAHGAQAIGMAAALCKKYKVQPAVLGELHLNELQLELLKSGQHLPGFKLYDKEDLIQTATSIKAESLQLNEIPAANIWKNIEHAAGQMLPVKQGEMPTLTLVLNALEDTTVDVELRKSSKPFNHTPDLILETKKIALTKGLNEVELKFESIFPEACYAFVCFMKNKNVVLQYSEKRITGLLSVFNSTNPAVSNYGKQDPQEDIGVEAFEFWCPQRRPEGKNIAMKIHPAIDLFQAENLRNGLQRPVASPNAWVAELDNSNPEIIIRWDKIVKINEIVLSFDCDYDNPMENVLMQHSNHVQPFCATDVKIMAGNVVVATIENNHQAQQVIKLANPLITQQLTFYVTNRDKDAPVSLFEIRCY